MSCYFPLEVVTESEDHRMVWVGTDPKDHQNLNGSVKLSDVTYTSCHTVVTAHRPHKWGVGCWIFGHIEKPSQTLPFLGMMSPILILFSFYVSLVMIDIICIKKIENCDGYSRQEIKSFLTFPAFIFCVFDRRSVSSSVTLAG